MVYVKKCFILKTYLRKDVLRKKVYRDDSEGVDIMFKIKKNVDWSLLHQGLTIPVNMHEEISQKLEIGEKRPIVIREICLAKPL